MRKHAFAFALAAIVVVSAVLVFGFDVHAASAVLPVLMADATGFAKIEKEIETLGKELKAAADEVKKKAEDAQKEMKSLGTLTEETKKSADEALVKHNELANRVQAVEQALVQREKSDPEKDRVKSIGEQFVDDEKVKAWCKSDPTQGKADLRIKATLTSLTTDAAGSVGDAIRPTRLAGILPLPQRRMVVRDLISPGQMDGNTLEYVKETGFTNAAGMVAEGAAKPESDIKLELVSTGAKVIAHWMKASKQVLSDIPQLRSVIDQRLLFGLDYKEEGQLLNGDGTGQNLLGIIPQATAYAAPTTVADINIIDVLRMAMLQAALAEYPATGHVMHPTDWAVIETLKDGEGRYIIGQPQGQLAPTLWRLPVVETQAITVRKFLTGAFKLGAQLFDRWDSRVEAGFVNDDFIKNLVTILAEKRVALAVNRPEAFVYGDFDTALAQ